MIYMGSKRLIASSILPIILEGHKPNQWFVEPFCGGCNITQLVKGKVIASDINGDIISFYKSLQEGWNPPKIINEEFYTRIKANGPPELRGYAGLTHSFGGKFLCTYRRYADSRTGELSEGSRMKGNYANIKYNGNLSFKSAMSLRGKIKNVKFYCCSYYDLEIPKNSIIYCDPPYAKTTSYNNRTFPHENFWLWCERMANDGHKIFISEYSAPEHFKCVWSKEVKVLLNLSNPLMAVEKLFTLL